MNPKDAPTLTPPAKPPARASWFRLDNRFLAPILITAILLVGELVFSFLESYTKTALAIIASILMEMVLGRLVRGKWPHLASAYITGISVGILVRSPELWPYILCSLIAITSKYAIRVRGRHLWNPSNLAVGILFFLTPDSLASLSLQWGNVIWPILLIWLLGALILYRLGRLHITLTYAVTFLVLGWVRSAVTGDSWLTEVAPITGPMYQLFIFFMITDPPTTTRAKWSQCLVAFLVAVMETVLRLTFRNSSIGMLQLLAVDAPYFALFIVGPISNLVEIAWTSSHAKHARVP
jgi:Na+-transporting NADH:ubiquinone oxidoreductase subunit NqrB